MKFHNYAIVDALNWLERLIYKIFIKLSKKVSKKYPEHSQTSRIVLFAKIVIGIIS